LSESSFFFWQELIAEFFKAAFFAEYSEKLIHLIFQRDISLPETHSPCFFLKRF